MARPGEPLRERRGRLTIRRMPVEHRRGGLGRYVMEHAVFLTLASPVVTSGALRRRFDLVQVNSPPDTLVLAALVPKLLGVPLLVDFVEATPEFFATRFGVALEHPGPRAMALAERLAMRLANAALTGTPQMRAAFASRGADADRITVVLNASDERVFDPERYRDAEREEGAFTLISHGSIEPRYGLDTVIRAVALLRERVPGLRLEIYGEGSQRDELRILARQLDVQDRVWVSDGLVPIQELVTAIARADAGVVAVRRDAFRDLTHTNKMFDYVAMRRPVIASWTKSVADLFDERAFEFFRSDDPVDLARAIEAVASDPARRAEMVQRTTELHQDLRWELQRARYLALVRRLAARP